MKKKGKKQHLHVRPYYEDPKKGSRYVIDWWDGRGVWIGYTMCGTREEAYKKTKRWRKAMHYHDKKKKK